MCGALPSSATERQLDRAGLRGRAPARDRHPDPDLCAPVPEEPHEPRPAQSQPWGRRGPGLQDRVVRAEGDRPPADQRRRHDRDGARLAPRIACDGLAAGEPGGRTGKRQLRRQHGIRTVEHRQLRREGGRDHRAPHGRRGRRRGRGSGGGRGRCRQSHLTDDRRARAVLPVEEERVAPGRPRSDRLAARRITRQCAGRVWRKGAGRGGSEGDRPGHGIELADPVAGSALSDVPDVPRGVGGQRPRLADLEGGDNARGRRIDLQDLGALAAVDEPAGRPEEAVGGDERSRRVARVPGASTLSVGPGERPGCRHRGDVAVLIVDPELAARTRDRLGLRAVRRSVAAVEVRDRRPTADGVRRRRAGSARRGRGADRALIDVSEARVGDVEVAVGAHRHVLEGSPLLVGRWVVARCRNPRRGPTAIDRVQAAIRAVVVRHRPIEPVRRDHRRIPAGRASEANRRYRREPARDGLAEDARTQR